MPIKIRNRLSFRYHLNKRLYYRILDFIICHTHSIKIIYRQKSDNHRKLLDKILNECTVNVQEENALIIKIPKKT